MVSGRLSEVICVGGCEVCSYACVLIFVLC
jgi:hypothetical protein